ncbi:MAG: hypothetical protein VX603_19695 [Gemmatimonadota bacterium]|nr:hypothetical protein [Gemmatimonadota bacterium]
MLVVTTVKSWEQETRPSKMGLAGCLAVPSLSSATMRLKGIFALTDRLIMNDCSWFGVTTSEQADRIIWKEDSVPERAKALARAMCIDLVYMFDQHIADQVVTIDITRQESVLSLKHDIIEHIVDTEEKGIDTRRRIRNGLK